MRHRTIDLLRRSTNAIEESRITEQLERIAQKTLGKTYSRWGWRFTVKHQVSKDEKGYAYQGFIKLYKKQERERDNSEEVFDKQFAILMGKLAAAARALAWRLADQQEEEAVQTVAVTVEAPQKLEIAMPTTIAPHFAHIFDREPQIRVIHAAIEAAVASNFTKRNHCLLWGLPACGKTEILLAFERMLGAESVCKLDATSTTKAGAENLLLEMDRIPPILLIEELEKCNPVNLPWLLGVLDQRGEIIKTNARIGSIRKEARCLCLATVNNLAEFQTIMAGALASRFQHKLYCPRPSDAVLRKILAREIAEINGKTEWIQPALDYCIGIEKTNDPRRIIAILDGKDKLLTGEYQQDLQAIRDSMAADNMSL